MDGRDRHQTVPQMPHGGALGEGRGRTIRKEDEILEPLVAMPFAPSSFLLPVVRPGAPSSFLPLVAMPFAPSSFSFQSLHPSILEAPILEVTFGDTSTS